MRFTLLATAILATSLATSLAASAAWAGEDCPTTEDEIQTDRPDVTNSSVVVPAGSLQLENGIDLVSRSSSTDLDGTNSRLRFGLGGCFEILVDLPNGTHSLEGNGVSGFSDLAPALKKQIGTLPGDIELSATVGVGLPGAAQAVSGHGFQPYLQFPWSHPFGEGWEVAGMLTAFWFPRQMSDHRILESTLSLEREIGPRADLFAEFVGDYPSDTPPRQFLNFGGSYRVTPTQQIDFHTGFGLDNRVPKAFIGIGYSWRWDRL